MKYVENLWETGQKKCSYKTIKEKIKYDKLKALISKKKKDKIQKKEPNEVEERNKF